MNCKILWSAYFLIVLLSCMLLTSRAVQDLGAVEWIVDDDGPADFCSIQEAINAASNGDIIYVKMGTYNENLVVNKTVSLVGENRKNTVISAWLRHNRGPICVKANNVSIKGFTVRLQSSTYYTSCILVDHSKGNNISYNTLVSGDVGIHFLSSDNNILANNEASGNHLICISLQNSSRNIVVNNSASDFPDAIGILVTEDSNNNLVAGNNVSALNVGITLEDSNGNMISRNVASMNECGVSLIGNCSDNTIVENRVLMNECGVEIDLDSAGLNLLYHNEFTENNVQARVLKGQVSMDSGYPTGGNYWSNHSDEDLYSGPLQDETGSDGIVDQAYVIDENNVDRYPIVPELPTATSILLLLIVVAAVILERQRTVNNQTKDNVERSTSESC